MNIKINQDICLHPITLRFSGEQEKAFFDDYFLKSIGQVRFSCLLGIFLYSMFGILDYLLIPDVKEQIWVIRFAVACPFMILFFFYTWSSYFKKWMQPSIVVLVVVIGSGIIAMTIIAYPPGSYYYYAGLLLVLMWSYTFVAARFIYATLAGWILVALYEVVAIGINRTPTFVLISNSFFFISANIIGMLACYLMELYKRRDFCQRHLLDLERAKSDRLVQELHSELELASEIQQGLLPSASIEWHHVELMCYSKPTLEIGGDFYSYHLFDEDSFALAVGDVSGHGIPAALLMATTLSLFNSTFSRKVDPCERLAELDRELVPYTETRHQNCAFCYLELDERSLYIANAGGIPPYIRRMNGHSQMLNVGGFPLGHGLGAEFGYKGEQVTLAKGDMVVLVTDGAVEARNSEEFMFGFDRLERVIARGPNGTAQAMLDHVVDEVTGFIDVNQPQDDFTIVVIRIKA